MRQRVGDGYKRDRAALDADGATVNVLQQLHDGLAAANLIAMHRAQHQQRRAGGQAVKGVTS